MPDPPKPQAGLRRPPYGDYQIEVYTKGILLDQRPIVTTNPNKLEEQARRTMEPGAFNYIFGGAGEQATVQANRLAFRQWRLIPRMLRPSTPRDLRIQLFGRTYNSPVLMAPIGVQSAYHADAEPGVAAACAELGVPFILSTASSKSPEEVFAAADAALKAASPDEEAEGGPDVAPGATSQAARWFQLYWPTSRPLTASVLSRARALGCAALVVTLDTFAMAWRPLDLDGAYLPFATGTGNAVGFSDPVFRGMFAEANDGDTPEDNPIAASRAWTTEAFSGTARAWEDLRELRELWGADRPILLKGILCAEDAKRARDCGLVDGIIVSSHGGRQLDGAVGALEMLPEIVDAVGRDFPVLFDSGIRTGADIVKALALGARAVLVGRPVVYGLGIAGREGAKEVLAGLLADLDMTMGLAGCRTVAELNRGMLRTAPNGLKSSL